MKLPFLSFLFSLLVLSPAESAFAQTYCKDKKDFKPVFNVVLNMPEPEFIFTKSRKELTDKNKDRILQEWATTKEKRAWIEKGHVAGLARGGSGYHTRANFVGMPYGRMSGNFCPFFKTIQIEIFYATVIFVAKEYKEGSCDFKTVLAHEFRHHDTNQRLVRHYFEKLQKDLPVMADQIENYGYVTHDKVNQRFALMQQSILDAIDIYADEMQKEIEYENGLIDSLENYKKESMICDGKK